MLICLRVGWDGERKVMNQDDVLNAYSVHITEFL